jgi:uncharacterized protein YcnI
MPVRRCALLTRLRRIVRRSPDLSHSPPRIPALHRSDPNDLISSIRCARHCVERIARHSIRSNAMRTFITAIAVFAALSGSPSAHVTANPNEGTAGTFFQTSFRVPHGCGGSPTVAIRVKMPDGVTSVKPQMKPGWRIEITMRKLDQPIDVGHGQKVTETVDEVAWRGGPLPDAYYDDFGLQMRLPARPEATLWFPTVQDCERGVTRWIEIPAGDQKWNDLREPAPFVKLRPVLR